MHKEIIERNDNRYSFIVLSSTFILMASLITSLNNNFEFGNRDDFKENGAFLLDKYNIDYSIDNDKEIELKLTDEQINNSTKTDEILKQFSSDKSLVLGFIDVYDNLDAYKDFFSNENFNGYSLRYGYDNIDDKYYFFEIKEIEKEFKNIENKNVDREHSVHDSFSIYQYSKDDAKWNFTYKKTTVINSNIQVYDNYIINKIAMSILYLISLAILVTTFALSMTSRAYRFKNIEIKDLMRFTYKKNTYKEKMKKFDQFAISKFKEHKNNSNIKIKEDSKKKIVIENN